MLTQRHARHIALPGFGVTGQARVAHSKVLLVGLGGLGCPAAQYLTAAGVGTLVLNDFDRVDASNLARQVLYTPADIGVLKVDAAAARLAAMNPEVRLECLDERLDARALSEAVARCDLVLDGSDNLATRLAVNAACVSARTPLVTAAVIRLEGQLLVCPNDGSQAPCYQCLYDDRDEHLGDCRGEGVLGPVAGVMGTLMASEALMRLAGLADTRDGGLLLVDAASGSFRRIRGRRNPDCAVCADASAGLGNRNRVTMD